MKDNLVGAAWRLAVFMVLCAFGLFSLLAVFAELRFEKANTYKAEFTNVTGLKTGDFVRIAGVEVGKVEKISITQAATAVVEFTTDQSVSMTEGTKAMIRWADPIGGRLLALEEGAGGMKPLQPGQTIPLERTEPAMELDTLMGGFKPLFRALNPEQVNALAGQLVSAFQGQGVTISSFLQQTSSFTNALADRDKLIGEVINNLNVVLGSFGEQNKQFSKTVDQLSQLVKGLSERKVEFTKGLTGISTGTADLADLLQPLRQQLPSVLKQVDRVGNLVLADHDYFDNLLNTLPDTYKTLSRMGVYGDFFTFYLCDAVLKLNGKGGQPVYVKVAGQDTGRCGKK
ncbi:MCE family protein [Mycolicibacterium sp. CBMA 234]|uniref:MCE family protein n=1 Tax=Mycolicibacterium sp. CBMA 234 TaxID=1918495 RepID=UPI0013918BCC|nr:MCE family protein [Mycolicibacterium sp. CBMA 234]